MVLSKRWVSLLLSAYDPQTHRAAVAAAQLVSLVFGCKPPGGTANDTQLDGWNRENRSRA